MQLGSFNSVHAYHVNFSPTDRDGILIFACPQERTEPEEAETRDRAEEDIKKGEAAKRQKLADYEQEQKATFQELTRSSAVPLSRFCAYISCSFLSNLRRSDFHFCMSPGAHRTGGGGQKEGGGCKASKASGWGATAKGNHANCCSTALSILCIRIMFISFQLTQIGFCFLHVAMSAPNKMTRTERTQRRQSVKGKWMRSNSKR